ncbi:amino acid racemase [Erwiniaceae bacterium BAC15a-03b]|uniref:Amino acid racemase n=1 Tax=Winslowiella arboricola TaxID=2978220 RepID=A0A9J6PQM0_9GAMM|nr:amino acid racemase [Winslowiella arboricola]MCU5772508.1 amino acid racemase [Winslowiella arboricola]MCU5779030.1 amino acid racemase [Winslowiella arboricola]
MSEPFLLGILGGMGPLAAVDFQYKILRAVTADSDQQQIPMVIVNVPQIPDRQQALAGSGPSPLPQLLAATATLNRAGASHIVIACNTAHHWFVQLAQVSRAPLLHIADATLDAVLNLRAAPQKVGLIATTATAHAGWFQQRFARHHIATLLPTAQETEQWFVPGCYAVKRGAVEEGGALLAKLAQALLDRGAERLILACTEVPLALDAIGWSPPQRAIDPAAAMAAHCARLWQQQRAI